MEVPDGIPKWSGHKGDSELLQELTEDEGIMPKYKGKISTEDNQGSSSDPIEVEDDDSSDTDELDEEELAEEDRNRKAYAKRRRVG